MANPFGNERDQIDKELFRRIPDSAEGFTAKSIGEATQKVLSNTRFTDPATLATSVGQIYSDAALFAVFHKFMDEFDQYIHHQQQSPGKNLKLPFATEIVSELEQFGFTSQIEHLISIFFQMRRAFFFISRLVTGEAACVRELRVHLWRSLFTHDLRFYLAGMHENLEGFPILLLGETGVGKSQAAAALGRCAYIPFSTKTNTFSASFLDVYVPANISEFSQNLAESELFGHKKGSFTGALESYDGLLGRTHVNGVLFLDEIGELSVSLQVKLLRVLQERAYCPVGSHEQKRFSGRLVSATNADIYEKIKSGTFRSDLYYRLASDVIKIPTLRQRLNESPDEAFQIASRILKRFSTKFDTDYIYKCVDNVLKQFPSDYSWPGNVREFEQYLRSCVLHGSSWYQHFPSQIHSKESDQTDVLSAWNAAQWSADEMLAAYTREAYLNLGTYEKVAQRLKLDWRTVKKWVQE
ncbi:MAG: hypothetical protein RJB13_810 [Pseudomonadota bacterium]